METIKISEEIIKQIEAEETERKANKPKELWENCPNLRRMVEIVDNPNWEKDPLRLHPMVIYLRRILERCISEYFLLEILENVVGLDNHHIDGFCQSGGNSRWHFVEFYVNSSNILDIIAQIADDEEGWITPLVVTELVDKTFTDVIEHETKLIKE